MVIQQTILEGTQQDIQKFLLEKLPAHFLFHNYDFTTELVSSCKKLAKLAGIAPREKEILLLAALFYNTGYVGGLEGHEKRSMEIAQKYLSDRSVETQVIDAVTQLLSGKVPQNSPITILSDILHDATWSFLGKKGFCSKGKLLRIETENANGTSYTLKQWNKQMLELQIKTKFRTPWANDLYGSRKNKNIIKQKEALKEAKKKSIRSRTGKDFGRGIDTVYRVTLKNHIDLSSIADGKANMIISINTLILSILITVITAGISMEENLLRGNFFMYIPVLCLLCSSLLAIIFAVFSAMPKVSGSKNEEAPENKKQNMLFFGNFLNLDEDGFVEYLKSLKKDQEKLYDDLSRDLFNLGRVLRHKYRLLTTAYRVFVSGLAISLVSFLFIYFVFPGYM